MAKRGSSVVLLVAMAGWAIFGSWALWSDAVLGHALAFFFFSICSLGLAVKTVGARRGLLSSIVLLGGVAVASEYLQPRFTSRPAELADVASDFVGIGFAVLVVSGLTLMFGERSRLWPVLGSLCLAALAASLGLAVVGSGPIEQRLEDRVECWRQGIDPIPSVAGEPIIHVDGEAVSVGNDEPRTLGDGILSMDSTDLRCSVMRSGAYSIVATVVPASIESNGPTRIFTSSVGINQNMYNTHLGQDFDELSVRVRSGDGYQWESLPGVFVAGERVTVAVVVADGDADVFVDGEHRATFELVGDTFAEWDESFPILIGDEYTRDRTFEGDIESVSFFDRALSEGEAALSEHGG